MRNLAIIPARGGSKRLPGKNIQKINGKTLVEYAIEAAIESKVFSEIILTSDDRTTIELGYCYPEVNLHLRPPSLSGDTCKLRTVARYLLELYEAKGIHYDCVALIVPTSPLRTANDIKIAAKFMEIHQDEVNGVMSISQLKYPPKHSLKVDSDGFIQPMFPEDIDMQSQYLEPAYIHDGSIIFVKVKSFLEFGDFYMPAMMPCYINENRVVDINTAIDLRYAEFLLNENKN